MSWLEQPHIYFESNVLYLHGRNLCKNSDYLSAKIVAIFNSKVIKDEYFMIKYES